MSIAQQATEPRAKREMRSVLRHSLHGGRFDHRYDSTERGGRHCSGEFEQLLAGGAVVMGSNLACSLDFISSTFENFYKFFGGLVCRYLKH